MRIETAKFQIVTGLTVAVGALLLMIWPNGLLALHLCVTVGVVLVALGIINLCVERV